MERNWRRSEKIFSEEVIFELRSKRGEGIRQWEIGERGMPRQMGQQVKRS